MLISIRKNKHIRMNRILIGALLLAVTIAFGFGFGVGRFHWPPSASITSIVHEMRGAYPTVFQELPEYVQPHYVSRTTLFDNLPGTADVVMLGDSLTEGANWNELFPNLSIANRGIAGDTSAGVRKRLTEVISRQPKLIFLLIGSNDLAWGLPMQFTVANIEAGIKEILHSSKAKLVLQSVPFAGVTHAHLFTPEKVRALNAALKQLSDRYGIAFLDINRALAPNEVLESKYTSDGLHLTGLGYQAWANVIRPTLADVFIK